MEDLIKGELDWHNKVNENFHEVDSQMAEIPNQTYITEKAKQVDLDNTNANIGDKTQLNTDDKSSIVNAIKEVKTQANTNQLVIGTTNTNLQTTNNNVSNLQNQVTSLASGAPKAVSLASQMADTTKNYVYIGSESGYTSGNWYYYNGSSWVSGGVYQSTGIADDSINTSKRTILGEYGELITISPFNIDSINKVLELPQSIIVSRKNVYTISGTFDLSLCFAKGAYIFFNKTSKTLDFKSALTGDTNDLSTVTEDEIYLGTFWNPNNSEGLQITINGNQNFTIDGNPYHGCYVNRTRKGEYGFLNCYYPFDVDFANKKITFDTRGWNNITWSNGNYDFSTAITNIDLSTGDSDGTGWLFFNTNTHIFNFVPKPADSGEDDILLGVIWGSLYGKKPYLNSVGGFTIDGMPNGYTRKLEGKEGNFLGDSITAGVNSSKPYHQWLSQLNGFQTINNYGIGGTCISTGETNDFLSRYTSMDANSDVILVFGGTNDWGHSHILGDISSTDNSTFYGALKTLCEGLINMYPTKAIGFITPLQRNVNYFPADNCANGQINNKNGNTLEQFVQAVKDVCAIYSIPVLDLYHNCFYGGSDIIKAQILTDGLHPNDLGHKILARKIAAFIDKI
ncbi:SGNH/GDSL hydrolase family protein [Clostridium tyrobutyricum]|uniref:SGNH/GDSL hydrolase family protein n=1 Tax=Clostridium tyrobutyricum TaxID=1519 RepID=UPI001C380348|nr:SGNH/GDSL hydrolase family protein [Clostridium tyrobutyricum]MBV4447738.1 SGNH/GDSL hydrolase family protein [Clostridium tyrobutyricum]